MTNRKYDEHRGTKWVSHHYGHMCMDVNLIFRLFFIVIGLDWIVEEEVEMDLKSDTDK